MDHKWNKHTYVCGTCDGLFEMTIKANRTIDQSLCPSCFNTLLLLSVEDATINTNNETKEVPPMNATTEFLERQVAALQEHIEKKDAYIERLQDEVSQKTSTIMTVRTEQNNFRNTVKDFAVQAVRDNDITIDVAQVLAELCDFELTKTITITSTVDFEVEIEVPLDVDADDVIASLEYSVDAFDYSITDYSLDTRNVDWEDTIS